MIFFIYELRKKMGYITIKQNEKKIMQKKKI